MPALSKVQRRLFGMALAYKKGYLDSDEVSDEIKELSKNSEKMLKKFAKTKEKDLPYKIGENNPMATAGSVNGMGSIYMPGDPGTGTIGSGDIGFFDFDEEDDEDDEDEIFEFSPSFLKFDQFVNQ